MSSSRHPFELRRVLVQIAAVLDRVDPGLDGDVETDAAERMAHHAAVEAVRLVNQRLHLVEVEGARLSGRGRAGNWRHRSSRI